MEYFETSKIIGTEKRTLPASTYNVMRILFHQSKSTCVFVPIRSMQYQAIIDENEVNFVYAHRRTHIEFAWQKFKPQHRKSLSDAVDYEFIYYDDRAVEVMKRIQIEFEKFAQLLYDKSAKLDGSIKKRNQNITPLSK